MPISLGSPELIELNTLIEENIRVGRGQPPIYVDVSNNLSRILAKQNHVVFGRRGSGKSTLLLSAKAQAEKRGVLCIYFDSELIKENPYPDIVISILVEVFKYLAKYSASTEQGLFRHFRRIVGSRKGRLNNRIQRAVGSLGNLRIEPQVYDKKTETTLSRERKAAAEVGMGLGKAGVSGGFGETGISTVKEATETTVVKIARLQQDLELYHHLIAEFLDEFKQNMMLFVDDFYFVARQNQPDVIDYLHRLCKGTNMFLKLGTIKYRTRLYRVSPHNGRTIGVELDNDIFPIDLDYTLEDLAVMSSFLDHVLHTFAERVNVQVDELDTLFTAGGKKLLHLASGGPPRDFLNLFLRSQSIAKKLMVRKLEKQRVIGEAARQYSNEVKRQNFSEDSMGDSVPLEQLSERIRKFAVEDKRKTVILVDQEEISRHPEQYDRLKQLMDLRFVHLVDSNTSATYGGRRRYEGYMLDVGLWASPRIPGLVEVDFARRDASGRKDELRNCPRFRLV